jgi:hypothetical protein
MTRSLCAEPMERDMGLRRNSAGCEQERDERHRGATANDQWPAIS